VQLGAGYPTAAAAHATVASARRLVSATASESPESGFCLLGASNATLLSGLAAQWAQALRPADAVGVATAGHEVNVGCWARCEQSGAAELLWGTPLAPTDRTLHRWTLLRRCSPTLSALSPSLTFPTC